MRAIWPLIASLLSALDRKDVVYTATGNLQGGLSLSGISRKQWPVTLRDENTASYSTESAMKQPSVACGEFRNDRLIVEISPLQVPT